MTLSITAKKIFDKNINYFVNSKLKFILDSEPYLEAEDFKSELFYKAIHAYYHALNELKYSEEDATKYGRKAIENGYKTILTKHTFQRRNSYIITVIDEGSDNEETCFVKKKISLQKIEHDGFVVFGENNQEQIEQKEIISKIMASLTSKERHIFEDYVENDFKGIKQIAKNHGSSEFVFVRKLKCVLRKVLKKGNSSTEEIKDEESYQAFN